MAGLVLKLKGQRGPGGFSGQALGFLAGCELGCLDGLCLRSRKGHLSGADAHMPAIEEGGDDRRH